MSERRPFDAYYTEQAAVMELMKHLPLGFLSVNSNLRHLFEPCAGEGSISDTISRYRSVRAANLRFTTNDIQEDLEADYHLDAADPATWKTIIEERGPILATITNPPFSLAAPILRQALLHSLICCFLLRLSWLEPTQNRSDLLNNSNLWKLIVFNPRLKFGSRGTDSVTTAWFIWTKEKVCEGTKIIYATDWKENGSLI